MLLLLLLVELKAVAVTSRDWDAFEDLKHISPIPILPVKTKTKETHLIYRVVLGPIRVCITVGPQYTLLT